MFGAYVCLLDQLRLAMQQQREQREFFAARVSSEKHVALERAEAEASAAQNQAVTTALKRATASMAVAGRASSRAFDMTRRRASVNGQQLRGVAKKPLSFRRSQVVATENDTHGTTRSWRES